MRARLGAPLNTGPDPPLTAAGAQPRCCLLPPGSAVAQRADAVPRAGAAPASWPGRGSAAQAAARPPAASAGTAEHLPRAAAPASSARARGARAPGGPICGHWQRRSIGCEGRCLPLAAPAAAAAAGWLIPARCRSAHGSPGGRQPRPPRPIEPQLPRAGSGAAAEQPVGRRELGVRAAAAVSRRARPGAGLPVGPQRLCCAQP